MTETWDASRAAASLRAPGRDDDKYTRGVVGMRAGSRDYPGAAVLGVEAAWRTGVGMVRYLGPVRAADLVLARRPETVTVPGRVQAWVIGSGTDAATRTDTDELRGILAGTLPVIADAGALDLVTAATAPCLITPHGREHAALRAQLGLHAVDDDEAERMRAAAQTAAALGACVLLKGSVTLVAAPSGRVIRIDAATPWLATAGTGDVLAGVAGAVVAAAQACCERRDAGLDADALADLAATAAWLHGRAGVVAAARNGGGGIPGPVTALDVARALPQAVAEALSAAP